MKKRGQMKLSFGMIFSIILIIFFIAFAFYFILKFVGMQDTIKTEQFKRNLQDDVDKMWRGAKGSQIVEYSLSKKITAVCFGYDEEENLEFKSEEFVAGAKINHMSIEKEFCINNQDGKVKMILKKDYGDESVTIENEK